MLEIEVRIKDDVKGKSGILEISQRPCGDKGNRLRISVNGFNLLEGQTTSCRSSYMDIVQQELLSFLNSIGEAKCFLTSSDTRRG